MKYSGFFSLRVLSLLSRSRLLLLFGLLSGFGADAQSYILYEEVPVGNATDQFLLPWAGGLNNPQFSQIDIDGDGNHDLFIFDRDGDKVIPLLHDGTDGQGYTFAPWEERHFPVLTDWAVMEDMNCDGIEDIITSWNSTGVVVYTGQRTGTSLSFNLDTNRLTYLEDGFTRFLGVTEIDIPEVEDIDGDGDMDFLTFNLGGGYVEWFKNLAAENGDPCGPVDLVLQDDCWGRFYESGLSVAVDLDTCHTPEPLEDQPQDMLRSGVHAGSTLMVFDEEGDGDWDLVLGDLSFSRLNKLENGGTPEEALMVSQDINFPSYNIPFDQNDYPAPFRVDADGDGQDDMLVSPNSTSKGEGIHNVWFYRDTDPGAAVVFELQADSFLVGDMVETGRGAGPVFFDHNGDGLLDIVIGNSAYTPEVGAKVAALALYENVGTSTEPAYELITRDYAGIRVFGFENVHPAFGDLDGDGDADLLIGVDEGDLHFFANNPTGGVANFVLNFPAYQGIDPGKESTPFLVDLDRDGDLDLLIGERNGNLNYFENQGTSSSASFVEITETMGGVVLQSGETNIGNLQVQVVENSDGAYELYAGERQGRVYRYTNLEDDLLGTWTLADSMVGGIDEGSRSKVAVADINGDGVFELLTGNLRGGLTLYKEGEYPSTGLAEQEPVRSLDLYPNPVADVVLVNPPADWQGQLQLRVYDLWGSLRLQEELPGSFERISLNTAQWPAGIYLLELRDRDGGRAVSRLVKN